MTLHHPELRIRQPARLVQDAVGDCDLADIVKQGDIVNVVEFVRLYTEAFSDLSGIVADADGVAVRVFVLGVDGPGNCLERFQRNVLILQLTLQRLFCLETNDQGRNQEYQRAHKSQNDGPEPPLLMELLLLLQMDQKPVGLLAVFVRHIEMEIIASAGEVCVVYTPVVFRIARIIRVNPVQLVIGGIAVVWPESKNGKIEAHTGYVLPQLDILAVGRHPVEVDRGQSNPDRNVDIPCQVQPVDINAVRGLEIVILLRSIIIPRGVGDDRLQSVGRIKEIIIGQTAAFQRIGNV